MEKGKTVESGKQQLQVAEDKQDSLDAFENSSCSPMPVTEQTTAPGLTPPHGPCNSSYSALPFADINIHLRVLKTPYKPAFRFKQC